MYCEKRRIDISETACVARRRAARGLKKAGLCGECLLGEMLERKHVFGEKQKTSEPPEIVEIDGSLWRVLKRFSDGRHRLMTVVEVPHSGNMGERSHEAHAG